MKLKVGDFLINKRGKRFDIAVVTSQHKEFYWLNVITSFGTTYAIENIQLGELIHDDGWKKFNAEAWYALGQIS